jgi:hypothetical protein
VGTGYELRVSIPVGTTASVHLPLMKFSDPELLESGHPLFVNGKPQAVTPGITSIEKIRNDVVCRIGSGDFAFAMGERDQLGSK